MPTNDDTLVLFSLTSGLFRLATKEEIYGRCITNGNLKVNRTLIRRFLYGSVLHGSVENIAWINDARDVFAKNVFDLIFDHYSGLLGGEIGNDET